MAWSYGNKLWTFSFKSLNGTSCRVDIYKRGYNGSTVLTLTPSDNPFSYDEDVDSDLLNKTIRFKTGYIRVEETEYQPVTDLYPTADDQHYVEFYYGERLDFVGFMQAQSFSNTYATYPRTVSFPIASPLWVMTNKKFNWQYSQKKPSNKTLGALLDEMIADNLGVYTYVMFPYFSDIKLNNSIYSQVIAPWNKEHNHVVSYETDNPIYEPVTYGYLLDAICKAFGWVVHDDVQYLTFSMFDYTDRYAIYPVGHIGATSYIDTTSGVQGGVSEDLEDSLAFADDNARESMILPYSAIRMNYEGEMNTEIAFSGIDRTHSQSPVHWSDGVRTMDACFLTAETGEFNPVGGLGSFNTNGQIPGGFYILAFFTSANPTIREGLAYGLTNAVQPNDTLFTLRFYTKFTSLQWKIRYKLESGTTLLDISENDTTHRYAQILASPTIGSGYIDFRFYVSSVGTGWSANDVMFFSEIEIYINSDSNFLNYTTITKGYEDIQGNNATFEQGEVSLPISMYAKNDRMIGDTIRSTKVTQYPYLLAPRYELKALFRVLTPIDHPWCKMWSYIAPAYKWRIRGYSFEPWNDEMIVTMERSTTLT